MAGFGNALLRGLAGAAEGYGDYLTTQGKLQAEADIEERKAGRAMALEKYRAQLTAERDDTLNQNKRGEIVLTGMVNRTNNIAELEGRAKNDAANDARDFEVWKKKNAVEFQQMKAKLGIELSNDKQRELFKAEQTIRTEREKEGMKPVGDDIDEATGTRVLYFKDANNQIRPYDTGVVVQGKVEVNPITGDVTRNAAKPTKPARAGWRDEQAPASSGGSKKVLSAEQAQAQLTAGIRKAKAGEPGWAGLTDRQVANKVRDLYTANGYEVPSLK